MDEPSSKRLRLNQDQPQAVPVPFQEDVTANDSPKSIGLTENFQQGSDEENYDLILNLVSELKELKEVEERKRKERMDVNNSFRLAYNNGDFEKILKVMLDHCDPNIRFRAPNMFVESTGIYALLAFFLMVNEVYPDSMVKFIEKRIATIKTSNPPNFSSSSIVVPPTPVVTTEAVEIIDKFVGTRVIEAPIVNVFREVLTAPLLNSSKEITVPEISQLVNHYLYADEKAIASSQAKLYNIITETVLTFDLASNKITEWTYTIVAVHST